MNHFEKLAEYEKKGAIAKDLAAILRNFYISYGEAVEENGYTAEDIQPILDTFLERVILQLAHPYTFEPYHQHLRQPFDYYRFGLDVIRPLVVFDKSKVRGINHIDTIEAALKRGENAILLSNHQTEPDPQAISLLLEKTHPRFAEEMIFVAGHRVISDPLAVPFSKGRNLLCIYSKRHIETDPSLKEERLLHNQRTMKKMGQLLAEGGKCIYVAPSGGRDRPGPEGHVGVAPFDPQSIELFSLIAKNSGRVTHFHPLALATYNLLPPPSSIEKDLGERRQAHCTPIHLAFGSAIPMDTFLGSDTADKKERRQKRADYIWKLVATDYAALLK